MGIARWVGVMVGYIRQHPTWAQAGLRQRKPQT